MNNGYRLPDGTMIPGVTATTSLSPDQQKLYDQENQISGNLNDLAIKGIGYVGDTVNKPIDVSKLPGMVGGLNGTTFNGQIADPGTNVSNYDFSQVSKMPSADDFAGQRDKITDAYMARLQPYLDRDRAAMDTKLATQGITHGSEAYNWDNDVFNRGVNDQRIAALLAGDQAQQNAFNNAMGIHQQGVNEAMSQGNFYNQAQQQRFDQNQARTNAANQAAEAQFQQGLASGQFSNQARSQALQEADYLKNQPLNMLNALRTGNQAQMPQFGNVAGGAQIQAAPVYQATADGYQAALDRYKIQSANNSAFMSGLASLGGAAITKFSDPRLKSNMELLSIRPDGLGIYSYEIFGKSEIGVNADEVAVHRPDALGPVIAGFRTVNYGVL
jgi:hypothetical protein